ncbi:argininosuccinate lyase [Candidatus Latescibacterota bacterium]
MKKKKLIWGGRFNENPDEFLLEFGSSITVDIELLEFDILGSIAWAEALGKANILNSDEVALITDGLKRVEKKLIKMYSDGEHFDNSLEDVHMTVESYLIELIGDVGAKLHTGRSRNDQVALDERLFLKSAIDNIICAINALQKSVMQKAEMHIDSIVPSYTHLQQAQPVRLAHYLMSLFWMLNRDKSRFGDSFKRVDSLPLGSGAVAGSGFNIDRKFLAKKLGFSSITENSIDAVSDRDYIIETLSCAAILMTHLSRFAEDMIIWSSAEFGFVSLPEQYSTGSSMMPQKKNPDSLELIRGKTGRVFGNLITLLTILKGLPLSYGKDMQEDKEPLFDSIKTIEGCLTIMKGVIDSMEFKIDIMESVFDDSVYATDIADYLTKKGLPFRQAHEIVGKLVKWSGKHNVRLSEIPKDIFAKHSVLFGDDVYKLFDLRKSADKRSVEGGTGRKALVKQLKLAEKQLSGKE